jgi:hypothetical protein
MKKLYPFFIATMLAITAMSQVPPCSVTLTTSGTWICPANVNSVKVECWGGGGQGGEASLTYVNYWHAEGGGAGGGAYASSVVSVTPGNSYPYVVGTGGSGTGNQSGNNTTFNSTIVVAVGGSFGVDGVNGAGAGGAGGQASAYTGTTTYSGGAGASGNTYNPYLGVGGSGGGSAGSGGNGGNGIIEGAGGAGGTGTYPGGVGGVGGAHPLAGTSGTVPGGGGGGGGIEGCCGAFSGGAGGDGMIKLTYIVLGTPATPTGPNQICYNTTSSIVYTTGATNASAYTWEISPSSAGTISGTGTSTIINWNSLFTNGNAKITVSGIDTISPGNIYTSPNSDTLTITVIAAPAPPTTSNNGPVCTGNTLSLTASMITGATYSWTGPNGFTSIVQNPTVSTNATTAMAGSYKVNATVTATGCTSLADSTTVVINQATANNNGPVCEGSTLSLTASAIPGATYFWTGPNGFNSTSQSPTVSTIATTAMAGDYSVYSTANGCTSPTPGTTTVVVNPIPNTPTAGNNGPVCLGNTLSLVASTITGATYSWTGPNSFTSTQQTPTVSSSATTAMAGTYYVSAIINGCASQVGSTTVEINKITASNNGPICTGSTLSLSATSVTGATYSWTGPNSFTSSQQNPIVSISATTAMAGVYNVTSTVNGCTSPSSVSIVIVNTTPSAPTVSNNGPVCAGSALSLTASSVTGTTYSWTGPNGFTSTSQNPTVSSSATTAMTGTYNVIATVNGCTSPSSASIVIVNTTPSTPVIMQVVGNLNSDATSGNQWYDDSGIITSATSQGYTPTSTGNYYCILTDANGCVSDTSNIIYVVVTGLSDLSDNKNIYIFPNPANDNITIENSGIIKDAIISIYNIQGQLLLQQTLKQTKTEIDISKFAKGLYILKIGNRESIAVKRFIKE